MPFSKCRQCGRLFHTFEPLLPDAPDRYWPNLAQGDAVYELCEECLKAHRDEQSQSEPNGLKPGD